MRDAVAQGKNAYQTAQTTSANEQSNANQVGSSLIPGLEREANNPTGFTPEEMNNQLVAGEQGAGGALSAVKGEADLRAARTRNTAGYTTALDEAARDKAKALSENALGVQNESAKLAQEKQMAAQKELGGLYGTDTEAMLRAQGLLPEDINSEVNANKTGWLQNTMGVLDTLADVKKAFK